MLRLEVGVANLRRPCREPSAVGVGRDPADGHLTSLERQTLRREPVERARQRQSVHRGPHFLGGCRIEPAVGRLVAVQHIAHGDVVLRHRQGHGFLRLGRTRQRKRGDSARAGISGAVSTASNTGEVDGAARTDSRRLTHPSVAVATEEPTTGNCLRQSVRWGRCREQRRRSRSCGGLLTYRTLCLHRLDAHAPMVAEVGTEWARPSRIGRIRRRWWCSRTSPRDGTMREAAPRESCKYSRRLGRRPRPALSQQRGSWPRRCSCPLTTGFGHCLDRRAVGHDPGRRSPPAAMAALPSPARSTQGVRFLARDGGPRPGPPRPRLCVPRSAPSPHEPGACLAALTHPHLEALPLPAGHVRGGRRLIAWLVHDGTSCKMWAQWRRMRHRRRLYRKCA